MDPDSRSGWSFSAQLNLSLILSLLVSGGAVLGLGYFAISRMNAGGVVSPDTTVLGVATISAAAVAVVILAIAMLRVRAAVRNRMLGLAEVCRQVSLGRRGARAPVVGVDEFAVLANAVNALLDGAPVAGSGAARPTMTPSFEAPDAAALQAQIEKLLQEVSAVGDGDLRVQAEVTPDTLGVLADSFNYMIEELAKVVGRVQATALQVTNATRRLLDRSAEVAQASEAQAMQINQTSDAVSRLADFVQLSATNALTAAEAARDALRNAQSGQQSVVQTIDGMAHIRENVQETSKKIKRLGERSQEVGEIVRLIEDIADQTNLLALNAAIQSAMAGEHGRGFAVVADEIRALAERVTEATKKIATLVKSIQGDTYEAVVAMEESTQEVVSGSRLADEAGRSLQSIYGSVERQVQIVENIASAAGERRQIAEAVAHSMGQIAEIARQTNAATQDATVSVSYLAELAEQLRASVATFRLPEQIAEAAGLPSGAAYPPLDMPGSVPGGVPGFGPMGAPAWGPGVPSGAGAGMPGLPALPAAPMGGMAPNRGSSAGGGFDFGGMGNPEGPGGLDGLPLDPQTAGRMPLDYPPADYPQAEYPPGYPDYGAENGGQQPQTSAMGSGVYPRERFEGGY